MLARLMFSPRPGVSSMPEMGYDEQLPSPCDITEGQSRQHISRLSPHKAPGTDGIPNIVLKKCAGIITPYLQQIFRATLSLGIYAEGWKEIVMCVLKKLGKPRYDILKHTGQSLL